MNSKVALSLIPVSAGKMLSRRKERRSKERPLPRPIPRITEGAIAFRCSYEHWVNALREACNLLCRGRMHGLGGDRSFQKFLLQFHSWAEQISEPFFHHAQQLKSKGLCGYIYLAIKLLDARQTELKNLLLSSSLSSYNVLIVRFIVTPKLWIFRRHI